MSPKPEVDDKTLLKIAKQYYLENKTQEEIARGMGVSRPAISKMLMKAKEKGIVSFSVELPEERMQSYEDIICGRLTISSCVIVPSSTSPDETSQEIVKRATGWLSKIVSETNNIGVGWGQIINLLNRAKIRNTSKINRSVIVPLIGSLNASHNGYNTNELVRRLSNNYGMNSDLLYAPAFPQSKDELEQFIETGNYKKILSAWNNLDAAVFQISNYPAVPDLATSDRYGSKLILGKAVGAILSSFYDYSGRFIDGDNNWSISIPFELLKKVPIRLGICDEKTTPLSLLGALRTGYITHLITTEKLAKDIIQLDKM